MPQLLSLEFVWLSVADLLQLSAPLELNITQWLGPLCHGVPNLNIMADQLFTDKAKYN